MAQNTLYVKRILCGQSSASIRSAVLCWLVLATLGTVGISPDNYQILPPSS
jgi:hypothetical protein